MSLSVPTAASQAAAELRITIASADGRAWARNRKNSCRHWNLYVAGRRVAVGHIVAIDQGFVLGLVEMIAGNAQKL